MRRTIILAGIFVFSISIFACRLVAPVAGEDDAPAAKTAAANEAPAWAAELTEIRRQLGGGALEGSLLQPRSPESAPPGDDFLKELGRLWGQQSPPEIAPPFPAVVDSDAALMASLRDAARLLDDKANRLEIEEDYRTGDHLRKLARRLRREARELGSQL